MVDFKQGREVIASKDNVYGWGKCLEQIDDGRWAVALYKGFTIRDRKMVLLNEEHNEKIAIQKELYNNHLSYDAEDEEEKLAEYYEIYTSIDSSCLEEGKEKVFIFTEEQMRALEDGDGNVRLVWNTRLSANQRLDIIGKLMLDPAEYDECIVGFDKENVYYDLEDILLATKELQPDCEPMDMVYNNMIPACRYITSAPYIRFLEEYDYAQQMIEESEELDEDEEEDSYYEKSPVEFLEIKYSVLAL